MNYVPLVAAALPRLTKRHHYDNDNDGTDGSENEMIPRRVKRWRCASYAGQSAFGNRIREEITTLFSCRNKRILLRAFDFFSI